MRSLKPHFTSSYLSQSPGEFIGKKPVMRTIAFWLSLIVIFKIPLEGVSYTGWLMVSMGLGLLGMAFWAATVVVTDKFRKLSKVHLAIYLFFLWILLSTFWSVDIDKTVKNIPIYFQMIVLFMMIWDLYATPAAVKAGLQAYVLGAYVSIGITIANYLAGIPASHWTTGTFPFRYSATGTHPNVLALILALGIPIAWHLAISECNSKMAQVLRLVNYAYLPAAIVAILLTGTRGAALASLPALFFILASMRRISLFHRILIFTALTCALFALFPLIPQYSLQRIADAYTSIASGDLTGRVEIWREGIAVFIQHPLLGIGNNAFTSAIGTSNPNRGAHNTFLALLVQVGIIGFALFAIILAMTIRYAWYQPKWDSRFWLTLLMVWTIGNVSLSFEYQKSTWLILALVAASASLPKQRDESILRSGFPVELVGSPNSSVVRREGPGRAEAKVEERSF